MPFENQPGQFVGLFHDLKFAAGEFPSFRACDYRAHGFLSSAVALSRASSASR
jgi:hypothetical protein